METTIDILTAEAAGLLKEMIAIPSPSFSEGEVCSHICEWMSSHDLIYRRIGNNIIARLSEQDGIDAEAFAGKRTLMLCAHIDTVSPSDGYSFDPYSPDYVKAAQIIGAKIAAGELPEAPCANVEPEDIIAGLGSNDDGASAVSMIAVFRYLTGVGRDGFQNDPSHFASLVGPSPCGQGGSTVLETIPTNACTDVILVLSCEEERSGKGGMTGLWGKAIIKANNAAGQADSTGHADKQMVTSHDTTGPIKVDYAIIGEPTGMKAATSERGLLVIDAIAHGVSGHAARNEGINAIDIAMGDIAAIKAHQFTKVSPRMGKVNINVTQINAGTAHNVIPDTCTFVIDIRPTEQYTNEEILTELQSICRSELKPRNLSNRSSAAHENSPLQKAAEKLGIETFSSPTTSDWMRIDCDAIKMGPGNSSRSHRKDEFVFVAEISSAIKAYIQFISHL